MRQHEREWFVQMVSYDVARTNGVHQAHGDPASERRVGAGPGVAYADDPGRGRRSINNETAVAVDDTTHGEDVGDRFAVEQVCVQRTCSDEGRPMLGIAELLQGLVARGDVHGHRPGLRVAKKHEEREESKCVKSPVRRCGAAPVLERK